MRALNGWLPILETLQDFNIHQISYEIHGGCYSFYYYIDSMIIVVRS